MRPSYLLALCCLAPFAWPTQAAEPEAIAYFEKHVRPIFVEKCQSCHGPKKQQGSLRGVREGDRAGEDERAVGVGAVRASADAVERICIRGLKKEGDRKSVV